jgi:hypothetical protein
MMRFGAKDNKRSFERDVDLLVSEPALSPSCPESGLPVIRNSTVLPEVSRLRTLQQDKRRVE